MLSTLCWSSLALSFAVISSAQALGPVVRGPDISWFGVRNATTSLDYFLGIPFAQPPVGPLRFKPPLKWSPASSKTTLNATSFGPSCHQGNDLGLVSSEDCLTLNIWKPINVNGKIPVMVWIYGGGFYFGGSVSYPGDTIVEASSRVGKPIIYVSLNYRTGIYGFPPGQDAADAGALNLGLKDQRLALEWVQNNIGYFGGDPGKVTLFGNSAGAISTGYQSTYRGGDIGGVFQGMILQSGSPSSVNVPPANDPVLEDAYRFFVNATGCANSTQKFECLRNAPDDLLSQANQDVIKTPPELVGEDQGPVVLGPVLAPGDVFLPQLPSKILRDGRFAKIPFINGAQMDEGTIFVNGEYPETEQDVINWLTSQIPGLYFGINNLTAVHQLLRYYPADPAVGSPYGTGNDTFGLSSQYKRLTSLVGDLIFQASRRDHLRVATEFGVKTWSYLFTVAPGAFPRYGVYHTAELGFVFQTVHTYPNITADMIALEEILLDYWLTFAYTLDPNPTSGTIRTYWPNYGSNETILELNAPIKTARDDFRSKALDFIINSPSLYN